MSTIPAQIGKYRILESIGRGGMGAVYKAEDATIGRLVAIKVLLTDFEDEEMQKRFYAEARSTGKLHHPNIVTLYDLGETGGSPYLVMQFLEGESLYKVLTSSRQLTMVEVFDIVRQVCNGLQYAHENQIIHRDIKPANVVLLPDNTLKIIDFGIAKFGNDRQTRTGMAIGSVKYMSPEQISGAGVDGRSDIYSTGVLLYELMTRKVPFDGSDLVSTMHKILTEEPPLITATIPDAPIRLVEILHKALAKKPEGRYQTAAEFADDLNDLGNQLKRRTVSNCIDNAKQAILARDWKQASDQLALVRRLDQQNQDARDLSREVRIFSEPHSEEDRTRYLLEVAERARTQGRFSDLLRICNLGLEPDENNPTLLRLKLEALANQRQETGEPQSNAVQTDPLNGVTQLFQGGVDQRPTLPVTSTGITSSFGPMSPKIAGTEQSPKSTSNMGRIGIVAAVLLVGGAATVAYKSGKLNSGASKVDPTLTTTPPSVGQQNPTEPAVPGTGTSTQPSELHVPQAESTKPLVAASVPADSSSPDTIEWNKIQRAPTTTELDRFISSFPRSPWLETAKAKREDLVWQTAETIQTTSAFSEYLNRYPTGRYEQRARDGILRLDQELIDFASDSASLEPLLQKYQDGDMHLRLLAKLDDLAWAHTVKDPVRLNEYLKAYPTGKHISEARSELPQPPKVPAYQGPTSGDIVWQGPVKGSILVTITGGTCDVGHLLSGAVPGIPVIIQPSDAKRIRVATTPAPSNSYQRLVFGVSGNGVVRVILHWSAS